jgi:hypothetical protein
MAAMVKNFRTALFMDFSPDTGGPEMGTPN